MTLSFTKRLHLPVPDFLTEPWHAEFAQSMDAIDEIIFQSLIAQNLALWENSTLYTIGALVISPDNGLIFSAAVQHTSSPLPTTFTQEMAAHPAYWVPVGLKLATQAEAETGTENTKYMSALRVAQAIAFQTSLGSSAFQTGDVRATFRVTADPGWVYMNDGTIGNAFSGATTRANADTEALWIMLYNNVPTLQIQNSSGLAIGRTGNASAQYNVNDRLVLPKMLGRAIAGAGAGVGLSVRTMGVEVGSEITSLGAANLPPHKHGMPLIADTSPGPVVNWLAGANSGALNTPLTDDGPGTSTPFNNMQPTQFLNFHIKL